jgi:hypothetical protein
MRGDHPRLDGTQVQRICRTISDGTGRDTVRLDPKTMVEKLNRMLIGWANYFCLGSVSKAYVRSIYTPAEGCVGGYATNTMSRDRVQAFSGSVSALRVWLGPLTTPDCQPSVGESMSLFREPDAGNCCNRTQGVVEG